MATYIVLCNYTHEGITSIKEAPDRVKANDQLAESCGAEMKDFYLTMGAYDTVALIEAPGDEEATRFALALSAAGNVRTTTLRAFTVQEFGEIVQALP